MSEIIHAGSIHYSVISGTVYNSMMLILNSPTCVMTEN